MAALRRAARRGQALERQPRPAASARPLRALPAAAALLALALLAGLAPGAQAQSTLVSNTGQIESLTAGTEYATAFTTGSNTYGYTLSAVDIEMRTAAGRNTVVTIRAHGTNPGAVVATLTNPSSFTDNAANTFTAPANTTLAANTTYFLVVNDGRFTPPLSSNVVASLAISNAQTGAAGWSIADGSRSVTALGTRFASPVSLRFAVKGITNGFVKPAGLTATPGPRSGQVTLSWTDPGDDRITSWQYDNWRGTPGAWGGWRNFSPGAGPGATSARISGLTIGTRYGFRIRARAGALRGTASDAATAIPPPPAKPAGLTAAAGPDSGQVTLRWTDPDDGGITGYQFRWRPSGGNWQNWTGGIPSGTVFTLAGFTNGTAYDLQIRAAAGGSVSAASDIVSATPSANPPPAKPTGLTATAGDGRVTLNWTNPGNSNITIYDFRARESGGSWTNWISIVGSNAGTTTHTVTSVPVLGSLTNGTTYDFQIRARDIPLLGAASDTVSATPQPPPPAKPTGLTATPIDGGVTLSWTSPNNDAITRWQFRSRTGGGNWGAWGVIALSGDATSGILSGLVNGTSYDFQIRAVAGTVEGAVSDTVSATPVAAPTPAVQFADDSAASLSEGASFARGYTLVFDPAPTAAITVTYTVTGTATRGTDFTTSGSAAVGAGIDEVDISVAVVQDALREGPETVILTLDDGDDYDLGTRTTVTLTITDDDPPLAPAGLTATVGDGQAALRWTDPSDAEISGYQYRQRTPPDTGDWGSWTAIASSTATTTTHTVTGLTNGTAYGFQVRAVDGTLEGAASVEATAMVGPPEVSVAIVRGESLTVDSGGVLLLTEDVAGGTIPVQFRVSASPATATDLTVCVNIAETGVDRVAASAEGAKTVTITGGSATVDYPAISWTDDAVDNRDSLVTMTVVAPSDTSCSQTGYTVSSSASSGSFRIRDNERTSLGLSSTDTTMTEGAASQTAVAAVTLGRRLYAGETLAYRVGLSTTTGARLPDGDASTPQDFTVSVSGTGVTATGLDTASPLVTFMGDDDNTVQVATLTFTPTAGTDADGADEAVRVGFGLPGSATNVGGGAAGTGSVDLTIDDSVGLVLSATTLTVAEGGSGTYTVALASQPTAEVTVTVGGVSGEVTVDTDTSTPNDQNTLTFTTGDWNTAQTVTVSADEDGDTANDSATLTHTAAGGDYASVTGDSVEVTVTDNDGPGVATATTDGKATEGSTTDTATFTVVLNTQPSGGVAVAVTAPAGLELSTGSTFASSAQIGFTNSFWSTPQTVTVRATDDSTDSPLGRELSVTYTTSSQDSNYRTFSGTAATVTVVDNDPTTVTLAGSAGDVVEGGTKTFTITLNRGLVNGETLPVPLTFGTGTGTATRGTDYTTACPTTLPTGVTCANLDSGNAMVTFTGPSTGTTADSVTLTLSATTDSTAESGGETVVIGLGTLDANSGTGLGGCASGTDSLADFSITDPDTSVPTVEITGVPDRISGTSDITATFTFSEDVTGFATDDVTVTGGTKGTFTATSATVYTLAITPTGGSNVVVTVAEDSATDGTNTGPASAETATAVWTALVFSSAAVTVVEEASATYTVALSSQPDGNVTVTLGGASGEVTFDTDSTTPGTQTTALTFSTTNWSTAQTVTVLAGEDEDSVNDTATLTHRASGSGYGSVTGAVAVTVTDNDEPSVFGGFAAWMPHFARVASEQILQGIGERVALHRGQGATGSAGAGRGDGAMAFEGVLAGQALVMGGGFADGGRGISAVPGRAAAGGAAQAMVERARGFGEEASDPFGDRLGAPRSQTLGAREALLGTAFTLTGERDGAGGTMAFWGQAGRGDFDGRERTLLLDGEVTTGMLGVDYAWDRALVGLALTRSEGEGGYRDTHSASRADDGEVEASLTAALPYASVHATPRLKLWGATGRGGGEVTLKTPGARYRANTEWTMAAAGMRGDFLTPLPEGAGASLALTADALWTRITSDRTRGLAASASSVTRVRLGLEGRYPLALDGDGQLTPRFEARARQDGGDAETGRGFELGAGLAFSDPALGLTLDLSGRTLIAHTDDDLKERGYQASLAFDPDPATKRGPSLGLRQEFGGRAEGGLDALFASAPLGERTGRGAKPRWAMETAWGFPALGGRFTASPHAGLGLAADAREISLGWRLTPEASTAPDLSLGLKAARRERNTALPQHTFGVEAALRW